MGAVLALKLHVSGPRGPICSVSLNAASKLNELKAAIAERSGIPSSAQRLFYGTEELTGRGALTGLLPPGVLEAELLLVRWSLSKSSLSEKDSDEEDNSDGLDSDSDLSNDSLDGLDSDSDISNYSLDSDDEAFRSRKRRMTIVIGRARLARGLGDF